MRGPTVRLPGLPPLRIGVGTLVTCVLLAVLVHPAAAGSGLEPRTALLVAAGVALGMVLCVLVHEIAHALVAQAFGARVDHIALTLWGGHTTYASDRRPGLRSATVSLAGPASNLLLAAALWGLAQLLHPLSAAAIALGMLWWLNLALAIFNLLPGLPMDGGRVLEGLLAVALREPRRGTILTAWIGRAIAAAVIAIPLWRLTRAPAGDLTSMLILVWGVLIATMLWNAASSALAAARTEGRIDRLDVARFARTTRALAPSARLVDAAPDDLVIAPGAGPRGQIGTAHRVDGAALESVPASERASLSVTAVCTPVGTVGELPAALRGRELLTRMLSYPHALYVVREAQPGADDVSGTAPDAASGVRTVASVTTRADAPVTVTPVVFTSDVNRFLRRG